MALNTSAPNVMSHHNSGLIGGTSSASTSIQHSGNQLIGSHTHNVSMPTNINNPSISFASNNAFTQPASPMDTSASYKD